MTTFGEWREYGDSLGRFASIREKAETPMDRIVVQNNAGIQKVVAGDFGKTLIVTIGPTNQPDSRAVVSARLFLTTLKTLKGKGEAELRVTDKGLTIQTSFGSTIQMDNLEGAFTFLKPAPYVAGEGVTVRFPENFLPEAAKYLVSTGDFAPFKQVLAQGNGKEMYFKSADDHIQATVGPLSADTKATVHFPDHVFPALRGLSAAGGIYIPEHTGSQVHQAQFGAGKYRVVTVILPNYGKFPAVAEYEYTVRVHGDKKLLTDTFKSLAGRHQFSRVVMEARDGTFTIRSGDSGAATLNIECEGTGSLPVNAAFMAKVLQTVDGKTATVQFADSPSRVRIIGEKNLWPILVAAMK